MSDTHSNPFATTDTAATPYVGELQPLYSDKVCMVTTFFATPLGAAVFLGINAHRTGKNVFAVVGAAIAVMVAIMLVGMIPIPVPGVAYTIAQVFAVRGIHEHWFKADMDQRTLEGVEPAPWMHAAVVCLVGLTLQFAFVGLLIWAVGLEGLADL